MLWDGGVPLVGGALGVLGAGHDVAFYNSLLHLAICGKML